MQRSYQKIISDHIANFRQMVFLVGARQVGKTTISMAFKEDYQDFFYINFDIAEDREMILNGPRHLWESTGGKIVTSRMPIIIFDEIHKYSKWKTFIKGFFDSYGDKIKIIVTGSARMDVYTAGGDSLMGRYLPYTICPLSVGEIAQGRSINDELKSQYDIGLESFNNLWVYGGFPELFLKANKAFATRMNKLRGKQLFHEDIRTLSSIQEISGIEMLASLLTLQIGSVINRSQLASKLRVAVSTVSRWLKVLEAFYYTFEIRPWSTNITRSLIKEPKIYLWDWSLVDDIGAKAENFIACHLWKTVNWWNDSGCNNYSLHYLRDKEKREVDFIVTKDQKPWFLIEVKHSNNSSIGKNLHYYQKQTGAPHAFQVVIDEPYVDVDCFQYNDPVIVPARSLLSQLA